MRTVFTVRYTNPVQRVWHYLAEPEKWLDYVPVLVERSRIDSGPVGAGSKRRSIDRVGPVQRPGVLMGPLPALRQTRGYGFVFPECEAPSEGTP